MGSRVEDDPEAINQHLIDMSKTAGRLRKLCPDGKISIDDLEIASLTASLPQSFSVVISPFERHDHARPKDASNAVRDELITRRNRSNTSQLTSSSANWVKSKSTTPPNKDTSSSSSNKDYQKRDRSTRQRCDYCQNFHGGKCHKKEIDELQKQISDLKVKTPAKSQVAIEDSDATTSDFSDSVARAALSYTTTPRDDRWNVDSGTTNCLVPESFPISNRSSGTISVRTANNEIMKSKTKGMVISPIPGIPSLQAHQIERLAEPLLSVSEVTDHDIGVVLS